MRSALQTKSLLSGPARTERHRGSESPYQRPAQELSKWKHDLFDPLSDLYHPRLNVENPMVKQYYREKSSSPPHLSQQGPPKNPSSSRRQQDMSMEFSTISDPPKQATSSEQKESSLFDRFSNNHPSSTPPSAPSSSSLASRMGLNIKSSSSPPKQPKRNRLKEKKAVDDSRPSSAQSVSTATTTAGTMVVVENLVQGTTAEDVTAAFQEFGSISDCSVAASGADSLTARLTFKNCENAQSAVQALNGVLADGKTLKVYIQQQQQQQQQRPQQQQNPAPLNSSNQSSQPKYSSFTHEKPPTRPRANYNKPTTVPLSARLGVFTSNSSDAFSNIDSKKPKNATTSSNGVSLLDRMVLD